VGDTWNRSHSILAIHVENCEKLQILGRDLLAGTEGPAIKLKGRVFEVAG